MQYAYHHVGVFKCTCNLPCLPQHHLKKPKAPLQMFLLKEHVLILSQQPVNLPIRHTQKIVGNAALSTILAIIKHAQPLGQQLIT